MRAWCTNHSPVHYKTLSEYIDAKKRVRKPPVLRTGSNILSDDQYNKCIADLVIYRIADTHSAIAVLKRHVPGNPFQSDKQMYDLVQRNLLPTAQKHIKAGFNPILRRHNATVQVISNYHKQLTVYRQAVDQGYDKNVNKPNMEALITHQNKYYLNKPNDLKIIEGAMCFYPYNCLPRRRMPTLLVELDDEQTKCGICTDEFSTDVGSTDESARRRLPVLSSSPRCDHYFCHGCILDWQQSVAEEKSDKVPKWLKCMQCREKTSFCPSEPKYHRLLIGLLRAQMKEEEKPKLLVELGEEHTECAICYEKFSTDIRNTDEDIRKRLPVLSSSPKCDHYFCHSCVLDWQLSVAKMNNGKVPKWLKCMNCQEKTSFCPSEPKYHRLLIDLLGRTKVHTPA